MPNLGVRVHNSKTTVGVKRKNMQQYYLNNAAMQQFLFNHLVKIAFKNALISLHALPFSLLSL